MTATAKVSSRRAFLARFRTVSDQSTDVLTYDPHMRPPWALQLHDRCTGCDECLPACPQGILSRGDDGLPIIDFSKGECTFCEACAKVCTEDVFQNALDRTAQNAWDFGISVSSDCFAENGIFCGSCGDACPERAIRMMPQLGGRARVLINEDACTGCGACVGTCPASAITITPTSEHTHG